jgi:CelD/BcsL family acetyltransferase involved in cellulose biosynthesis
VTVTIQPAVDSQAWSAILASDPNASFFHTPAWEAALLAAYPYFRPAWFVAADAGGNLTGALPCLESVRAGLVQRLSLPYGTYATPLAAGTTADERNAARAALLDAWWRGTGGPRIVRANLTLFVSPEGEALPDWNGTETATTEHTHLVDLSRGFEHLWSEVCRRDARANCRKAEEHGVTATREPDGVDVIDRLYREQAASWKDHTPFPPGLFQSLRTAAGNGVEGWIARHEGRPVAGQLLLLHRDTAFSWVTANRPEARPLRATTLLGRAIMEDLCRRGIRWFNFGGSRHAPGLEEFKRGLGGRPHAYVSCMREAAWFRPIHRLQYRVRGIREGPSGPA